MKKPTNLFFGDCPLVMGILNVTPDSFSDGGRFCDVDKAVERALEMTRQGADIIDIGGESTRPGAVPISIDDEIQRVIPVIKALKSEELVVSVDTRNAKTMEAAIAEGVDIINDVSALRHDKRSVHIVAEANLPVILMHMQGDPQGMQDNPKYNNVLDDLLNFFKGRLAFCGANRIENQNVVLDPGIGFGKTLDDNLLILRNIKNFSSFEVPIMLGASRKRFIAEVMGEKHDSLSTDARLGGSIASVLWALSNGVRIFRVHDVAETHQAIKTFQSIQGFDSKIC